jgi:hypothetical protein
VLKQATLCAVFVAVCLTITSAQTQSSGDDYHKNEFYVGYSNNQIDAGNRTGLHGVEFSYTRNFSRYFGLKADVSHATRKRELSLAPNDPIFGSYSFDQDNRRSITNVLAGVQVKDNSTETRFKPFAHAMAGIAHNRSSFTNFRCTSGTCPQSIAGDFSFNDTGFAAALGGGLDIKLSRRFDLRAIQVDYNPIYSDSRMDNNIRIGVGIVIH